MKAILAVLAGLIASPAEAACHRYSHWAYKFPQRCGVSSTFIRVRQVSSNVVKVAQAPTRDAATDAATALPPMLVDKFDTRTLEQIREAREHDAAVAYAHDEINARIKRQGTK